jgi:hypothetical protein
LLSYRSLVRFQCIGDKRAGHGDGSIHGQAGGDRLRRYSSPILEERIVNKAMSSFIAGVAAAALSGGVYAQANNTLATPTTKSPAAVPAAPSTSGYGTPGAINSESGMGAGSSNSDMQNGMSNGMSNSSEPAYGTNNTLARPSVKSPGQ